MRRVLIIDDSSYMRAIIKLTLKKAGLNIVGEAADGKQAIEMAMRLKPDLITLDNVLPDMFGIEILQILKKNELKSDIIVVSAVKTESIIKKVKKMGAADYISKPFEPQELIDAINNIKSIPKVLVS
jgi:two-component system chemotaxis response regulator CheY